MEIEHGHARIVVELSHGRVVVRHGDNGAVLFDECVAAGTWQAMWGALIVGTIPASVEVTAGRGA